MKFEARPQMGRGGEGQTSGRRVKGAGTAGECRQCKTDGVERKEGIIRYWDGDKKCEGVVLVKMQGLKTGSSRVELE